MSIGVCLEMCWAVVLIVVGAIGEAWASRKTLILLLLASLIAPVGVQAQEPPYLPDPIATSGMWAEVQCEQATYAELRHPFDDTPAAAMDVDLLMTMQYEVGVWLEGTAAPFGGHTFYHNDMVALIKLATPCGDKYTRVYRNRDSATYTVVVFIDMVATYAGTDEPCVYQGEPNPRRCGLHHGVFGFITAGEWARVSGAAQGMKRQ